MNDTPLDRQLEKLLDTTSGKEVDVIVQMGADREIGDRLAKAAGQAITRRRLTLTPRDLLPQSLGTTRTRVQTNETASTRTLLAKTAQQETFALKRIQESGLRSTEALVSNPIVQAALARMIAPTRKSAAEGSPRRFWTSRAMPLRLARDDLRKLANEVEGIKTIHLNRHLSVPTMVETRRSRVEEEEILDSTWGLERCNALAAWGLYGKRGEGVTIGLLDTGVDAAHPDLQDKIAHWAEFDASGKEVAGSQPHDSDTHGTHCAGTLVGGNSSGRYIGVAPEARIAAGLVLNGKQGGTDAQVLAGIDWAVNLGVDVISLSLGGAGDGPGDPLDLYGSDPLLRRGRHPGGGGHRQ